MLTETDREEDDESTRKPKKSRREVRRDERKKAGERKCTSVVCRHILADHVPLASGQRFCHVCMETCNI